MKRTSRSTATNLHYVVRKEERATLGKSSNKKLNTDNNEPALLHDSIKEVLSCELGKLKDKSKDELLNKAIVTVLKTYFKESGVAESSLNKVIGKIAQSMTDKKHLTEFLNKYKK